MTECPNDIEAYHDEDGYCSRYGTHCQTMGADYDDEPENPYV